MKKGWKGSYTVEAAMYIPIVLSLMFQSIEVSIDFLIQSKEREILSELEELDIVKEFYGYQIIDEIEKELRDD